jgi:Cation transport ATPase (P-type)
VSGWGSQARHVVCLSSIVSESLRRGPPLRAVLAQVKHTILNTLDFTSERARMSVVAHAPDGTIRLFTKGSDAVMLPRVRSDTDAELLAATDANLHAFSVRGLRTLVLGSKVRIGSTWSYLACTLRILLLLGLGAADARVGEQGLNRIHLVLFGMHNAKFGPGPGMTPIDRKVL